MDLIEDCLIVDDELGLIGTSNELVSFTAADPVCSGLLVFPTPSDSTLDNKLYVEFVASLKLKVEEKLILLSKRQKAPEALKKE